MNNNQFRKLVLDTPARKAAEESSDKPTQTPRNGATPSLGSRMRSSIPMTPRTVAGYSHANDFARQLAERNSTSQTTKKFRSSAAPKGAKLADGYVDRAKQRLGEPEEEEDDKVKRVKALEEMMKLQQIDEATFIKLRDEILGDEVGVQRAGLVKGLDWKMLERVRRGEVSAEDVLEGKGKATGGDDREGLDEDEDVDDEFTELEARDVEAVAKEQTKKKGEMAPPSLTGKKRNRDQILADLKAARQAAKDAAAPALSSRFKKVGDRRSDSHIERDSKGRQVLITVDEDGNEKRKVRKVQQEPVHENGPGLLMPDKDAKPLGMEVPALPEVEEDEDVNIFDDAGDDYDPLAGLEDEDSSDGEEGEVSESKTAKPAEENTTPAQPGAMLPPPRPVQKQNYFSTPLSSATSSSTPTPSPSLSDPVLLAALKKASSLSSSTLLSNPSTSSLSSAEEKARAEKHARMLRPDTRDADDMDMGFGSSRFADEEDFEEKKVKLSEWGREDGDEEGGKGKGRGRGQKGERGDGGERKRGPKKRKGDKDSAADVLKVIAQRKAGAGS